MSRGSPGARNTHAGKYGELTPSRQRGGGGWKTPATALPAQNPDEARKTLSTPIRAKSDDLRITHICMKPQSKSQSFRARAQSEGRCSYS